jgi:NAD(P)-dependent dehydrogenase (short-subunit alcohol dehydrogenase family)
VASAVLYIASDRARYVTGAPLVLDAGLLTR